MGLCLSGMVIPYCYKRKNHKADSGTKRTGCRREKDSQLSEVQQKLAIFLCKNML